MMLYAVIRTRGSAWLDSSPMELQPGWHAHAAFMNNLASEGFVVLGGPLEGTRDVLLVIRAQTAEDIQARLATDPWSGTDLLRVTQITPWRLRLGSLD